MSEKIDPGPGRQTYHRISVSEAIDLIDVDRCGYLSLDTETNGEDVRDGRGVLHGISIAALLPGLGYFARYFQVNHPQVGNLTHNIEREDFLRLKEAIESYQGTIFFFNAKFDLESLRTVGINYSGKYVDCMLWAHMVNENLPYKKDLTNCAKMYCGDEGKKESDLFKYLMNLYGWAGFPGGPMEEYAEYDAVLTYMLAIDLNAYMVKEGVIDYWFNHKAKFLNVIRKMESRGIRIDVNKCIRMIAHGEMIMQDIRDILQLNPGSPKDLEELLINRMGLPLVKPTKGTKKLPPDQQKPSFDKDAMAIYDQILENRHDETADLILQYRGWQKAVSSNYKPYIELLSPDGRLRPNYKLHGTVTGRSSCEKPNLQQIPREGDKAWNGDMKLCFLPEDGFTLWEFDYSQLELRLGTAYAKVEELIQVFEEGRDIFTEMSTTLGFTRQETKGFVYSTQYGAGRVRIAQVFNTTEDDAQRKIDNYYRAYPGFRQVTNLAKSKVRANGKIKLWSGRYRHFQWPADEARKAFNSVIQGGAADIVERQMIKLFEQVDNDEECRMLLTVHDSIVFEIKNGREDYYIPKIKSIMEDVDGFDGEPFRVRFAADVKRFGDKG